MDPEGSHKNIAVADREPLIGPGHTLGTVTDKISSIVLTPGITKGWLGGFTIAVMLFLLLNVVMTYLFAYGVGIWGINVPVAWAFAITNFVWWIGIGHAGTLISAFLLLMHQRWRTSINRFAEAMTIFAVMCAGMFPLLHMGRPWLFYYMMPYPESDVAVAAVPQPAGLGRVRGVHLLHGFVAVLVCGLDSGFGDASRQGQEPRLASGLWHAGDGLAWFGGALVAL